MPEMPPSKVLKYIYAFKLKIPKRFPFPNGIFIAGRVNKLR